jgi:uncharacterized SAM-binding protein YcdF (DUF218 family)
MTLWIFLGTGVMLAIYFASTPFAAAHIMRSLENAPPVTDCVTLKRAEAIVVLGGDVQAHAPEYGGETIGGLTLQRLRYAALLHWRTGLPVLVTGGRIGVWKDPVAKHMRHCLAEEFRVETRWIEDQSRTTDENAARASGLLADQQLSRICLVTHAYHMRRAKRSFECEGIEVLAAPTCPTARPTPLWNDFLPRVHALNKTAMACREWCSIAWIVLGLPRRSR